MRTLLQRRIYFTTFIESLEMIFSQHKENCEVFLDHPKIGGDYIKYYVDNAIRNLLRLHFLRVSHLSSYRANIQVESHHKLSNMSCQINATVSRFMFLPLLHITLIRKLLKFLNNIITILQPEIINGTPRLFVFI